jgi:hypothetical protein
LDAETPQNIQKKKRLRANNSPAPIKATISGNSDQNSLRNRTADDFT